jgi:alpha-ketoglutarate-dependent taurine dioxygenase
VAPRDVTSARRESMLEDLQRDGASRVAWVPDRALPELAAELGLVSAQRTVISVRDSSAAPPTSLSGKYGVGVFPWHTDGAQLRSPPRLLLMRTAAGTHADTPTLWTDGLRIAMRNRALIDDLREGRWLVRHGRPAFSVSAVVGTTLRFNLDQMEPETPEAVRASEVLLRTLSTSATREHHWRDGEVLILDNQRILHSRPAVPQSDRGRRLERLTADVPELL